MGKRTILQNALQEFNQNLNSWIGEENSEHRQVLNNFHHALEEFLGQPEEKTKKENLKLASVAIYNLTKKLSQEAVANELSKVRPHNQLADESEVAQRFGSELTHTDKPDIFAIGGDEWMEFMSILFKELKLDQIPLFNDKKNLLESVFQLETLFDECLSIKKGDLDLACHAIAFTLDFFRGTDEEENEEKQDQSKEKPFFSEEYEIYSHARQMQMQANTLDKDGYHQEATELRRYADQFKNKTENFLAKPLQERISGFDQFKIEMDDLIDQGENSALLKNHTHWHTALKNFATAVSVLGLIYLRCTAEKRGSFWFKDPNHPTKKMHEMKEALENKPRYPSKS